MLPSAAALLLQKRREVGGFNSTAAPVLHAGKDKASTGKKNQPHSTVHFTQFATALFGKKQEEHGGVASPLDLTSCLATRNASVFRV